MELFKYLWRCNHAHQAAQAKAKEEQAIALALEIRLKQQKIENEARKAREAKKREREQILDGLKKSNGVDLEYMQNVINYLQKEDDDDDSDYDEDNPKPPKPAPKPGLFLPNVLDNRSVKYFATPKLGSYFAVPITVASYLHADNQVGGRGAA